MSNITNYPVKMRYYTKLGNSFAIQLSDNKFFSSCCGMPIEEDRYLDIWCDENLESQLKYGLLKRLYQILWQVVNEPNNKKNSQTNEHSFYNEYYSEIIDQFDYVINERTFSDTYIDSEYIEPYASNYLTRYYPSKNIHCSKCKKKLVGVFMHPNNQLLISHKSSDTFCNENKVRKITPSTKYNIYRKKDYFIKRQVFKKFTTYNYESGYLYLNEQRLKDKGIYTIRNITYNASDIDIDFLNTCIDKRLSYLGLNIDKEIFMNNKDNNAFGWLRYPNAIPIKLSIGTYIAYRHRKKLDLGIKQFMKSIFGNSGQFILKHCEGKNIINYLNIFKFFSEIMGYDKTISNFKTIKSNFNPFSPPLMLGFETKKSEKTYFSNFRCIFNKYIGNASRFFNMINKYYKDNLVQTTHSIEYFIDILRMLGDNNTYSNGDYKGPNTKGLSLNEFHDIVSKDNRLLLNTDKREFDIDKKILDKFTYEDDENNVRYEVAKNVPSLIEYGSELHNCVASYRDNVINKHQLIIGIYNGDGKIKACMNLLIPKSGQWGVGQIKLKNNRCIKDDENLANIVKKYLTERGIFTDDCYDIYGNNHIPTGNPIFGPVANNPLDF